MAAVAISTSMVVVAVVEQELGAISPGVAMVMVAEVVTTSVTRRTGSLGETPTGGGKVETKIFLPRAS